MWDESGLLRRVDGFDHTKDENIDLNGLLSFVYISITSMNIYNPN